MACQDIVELTDDYVDAALPVALTVPVRHHLMACGDCSTYVDQIQLVKRVLRSCRTPALSSSIYPRLLAILRRRGIEAG